MTDTSGTLYLTEFFKEDGRIVANYTVPSGYPRPLVGPCIEGTFDHETHYVADPSGDNPMPRQRPEQATAQDASIVANGTSLTLSSLPEPCVVRIAGRAYDVPDGVLEWTTSQPGVYPIIVEAFPYLDWHGEVEVAEVIP